MVWGEHRYRSTSKLKLPIKVLPSVTEIGRTQVQYNIVVKTTFDPKLAATNVVLRIPTPLNTTSVDCKVMLGKAKYVPGENVVVWKWVPFSSSSSSYVLRLLLLTQCTNSGFSVFKEARRSQLQRMRA